MESARSVAISKVELPRFGGLYLPQETGARTACAVQTVQGDRSVEALAVPGQCQGGGGGLIPLDFISEWKRNVPWPKNDQVEPC